MMWYSLKNPGLAFDCSVLNKVIIAFDKNGKANDKRIKHSRD